MSVICQYYVGFMSVYRLGLFIFIVDYKQVNNITMSDVSIFLVFRKGLRMFIE